VDLTGVRGKVLTVLGPVEPRELGKVPMHEHLHADMYDWRHHRLVTEERPDPERKRYLLERAVPPLRACREHGCFAICDTTMPPWRAWPDTYVEVSRASGVHIVLATGFYREIELGTYFAERPEDQIWPWARQAPLGELEELCVREILEGIHGTNVHAGVIKLGTSQAPLTPTETKALRAGARAQRRTGALITTHCTQLGADASQLTLLESEGVDLSRVVIGHTAPHLMHPPYRRSCLEWMRRGACYMPTNLDVTEPEQWRPLVEAVHDIFDHGLGGRLVLGLDPGFCSESGEFAPMSFLPEPPFAYMFTEVLPAFRDLGLTADEEDALLRRNPQSLLPLTAPTASTVA
jgi:predicted metal-dependent phosphotriesterase family hydrolase